MKPFTVGSQVQVSALASVGYIDDSKKQVTRSKTEPFLALIVGKVIKQVGTYQPSYDDNWPGILKVEGTVTLWQVRTGMMNKILLVHDDDLELSTAKFTLPKWCSRRPRPRPRLLK